MSTNIKNHYDMAKQIHELETENIEILKKTTINFENIYNEMLRAGIDMAGDESSDCFRKATRILIPFLQKIHKQLSENTGNFEEFNDLLYWTSQPEHFKKCWELLRQNESGEHTLQILLVLTPILERSLGNLLLSVDGSVKVPALLRDLLKRSELLQLLGAPCILFLRIIFGSPHSLNLRNIIWHGFGFPGEISDIFPAVTFLIFPSIGSILKQKSLKLVSRKMLSISQILEIDASNQVDLTENVKLEDVYQLASNSPLFYARNIDILVQVHSYMISGEFGLCSVLLLPLLEVTFRKLFVIENECPERMLTAEAECLYTTYNEIFEEHLENGELNKIQKCLGEDLMLLMYDLLTLPDGPRVRDKLSHGEVIFSVNLTGENSHKVMKSVASHLFTVLVILLSKKISDHLIPKSLIGVLKTYKDYKSTFHPTTLLVKSLQENLNHIENINQIENPDNLELDIVDTDVFEGEEYDKSSLNIFIGSFSTDNNVLSVTGFSKSDILETVSETLKGYKGSTLYRPRQEYEVLTLLQKISNQISEACQRIIENMREKRALFESKEMRSRQRVTYKRMLETVPKVQTEFVITIFLILHTLLNKDDFSLLELKKQNMFVKYLKRILKICENICTKVHIQKNTWDEVEKLLIELKKIILEYRAKFS